MFPKTPFPLWCLPIPDSNGHEYITSCLFLLVLINIPLEGRKQKLRPARIRGINMKKFLLFVVGVTSICLSVACFYKKNGVEDAFESSLKFSQIDPVASYNVNKLIEINRFGFASILLVGGLTLVVSGIPESKKKKEEKCEEPKTE